MCIVREPCFPVEGHYGLATVKQRRRKRERMDGLRHIEKKRANNSQAQHAS